MQEFMLKNLLIHVLPEVKPGKPGAAGDCTAACSLNITDYTKGCCGGGCSNQPSGTCFPCSSLPTKVALVTLRPADLAAMKVELREALDEIEVREKIWTARLSLTTSEDAAALERHLAQALEEVRGLKSKLPSGSAKGTG